MEVSSLGMKFDRAAGIEFDVGVFTNLSPDHIGPGEHADFAEYLHWKAALFQQCRAGVFNIDDPWVGKIVDGVSCRVVTYGTVPGADVRADSNFTLTREGGRLGAAFTVDGVRYTVGMPGAFSVQNALAALAAARVLGAGEDAIRRGLAAAVVQGRVEPVAVDAPFTVLIDYAHNEGRRREPAAHAAGLHSGAAGGGVRLRWRAEPAAAVRYGVRLRPAGGFLRHYRGQQPQ